MADQRYVSTHIDSQLPDFVRSDHPMFAAFMEAYYEFLEQDPNAVYGSAKLIDYMDIDDTLDSFISNFKDMYLKNFPTDLALNPDTGKRVDEKTLVKKIKEFYSARGSEKSFNLLFQLFFNTSAEIYLPKDDMLIVGGGTWNKDFIIKTTSKNKQELMNTIGLKFTQVDSNDKVLAYGTIDEVFQYDGEGLSLTVSEFRLRDVYTAANFTTNGKVKISLPNNKILVERILPIVTGVTLASGNENEAPSGGAGYQVGDIITFSGGGLGSGARGTISEVTPEGSVVSFELSDYGSNYTSTPTVDITRRGLAAGIGGNFSAATGPYVETEGKYVDEGGFLSSSKKLQDSFYYQNYSYVIKSDMVLDTFKELVKKTIHPTGMNLFAQVQIRRELESDLPFSARMSGRTKPIIGHYTPYTFDTAVNLGFNGTHNLYQHGYNPRSELTDHNFGDTGGLVVITTTGTTGFSGGEFNYGEGVTTSAGKTAQVFNFSVIPNGVCGSSYQLGDIREFGGTGLTGYLRLMNFESGTVFAAGETVHGSTSGFTGTIDRVAQGNGTVLETGSLVHSNAGASASSLGGSSSTNDSPFYHTTSSLSPEFGRDFWVIYNHPNLRKEITDGATLGVIDIITMNNEEGAVREFTLGGQSTISQSINFPYVGLAEET